MTRSLRLKSLRRNSCYSLFTGVRCILIVLLNDEFHVLILEFHHYVDRSKEKKKFNQILIKESRTAVCKSKDASSTVVLLSLNRSNGDGVES